MKIRAALILSVCLFLAGAARAQTSANVNLTTAASDCALTTTCIALPINATMGGASFTLSGTFSATAQFEGSGNYGVTYVALSVTPTNSTTTVTSSTSAGTWTANVSGLTNIRIRVSAYTSGTIVATLNTSVASARANVAAGSSSLVTVATTSNCAAAGSAANPSLVACSATPAGSFSCSASASTGTCVISTTVVTAHSSIFIQPDAADSTLLSVTCNAASDTGLTAPRLASISAGTGFTINLGTFTTYPLCFKFLVVN